MTANRRVRARADEKPVAVRRHRSGLRRGLPLSAAIGSGLVLAPNRARSTVRPASAIIGTVLGVTGVLAIAVFVVSQRATADDPARYGWAWDVDVDVAIDDPEPLFAALAEEPALSAVGIATCGQSMVGDDDVDVCAMEVLSGSMPMTYLDGRAPTSPDEVAAGRTTMARHDVAIGDYLEVTGANGATTGFEVVGVAVMPAADPGAGLITTPDGFEALTDSESYPILTLEYAPDVERDEVERILADDYGLSAGELTRASPPALVARLELIRSTLVALAVFLGVLGVIGLLHFLMLSSARRRRETAVLEAVGFVRVQTIAVVVWQAITIAAIGVIVGIPLGVILGRSAWEASIDQLGIVDTPTVPWLFCAGVCATVLLAAGVIGILTGWLSGHRNKTAALRRE